jgi:hypothetical protein
MIASAKAAHLDRVVNVTGRVRSASIDQASALERFFRAHHIVDANGGARRLDVGLGIVAVQRDKAGNGNV